MVTLNASSEITRNPRINVSSATVLHGNNGKNVNCVTPDSSYLFLCCGHGNASLFFHLPCVCVAKVAMVLLIAPTCCTTETYLLSILYSAQMPQSCLHSQTDCSLYHSDICFSGSMFLSMFCFLALVVFLCFHILHYFLNKSVLIVPLSPEFVKVAKSSTILQETLRLCLRDVSVLFPFVFK